MATILYESYYGVLPSRSDYIEHHGIKGQKWYHRRFQNDDGSLTAAGRARYGVGPARKFKTKEERAAARAEKQEASRKKFSGKMQEKYGLIDVPNNKDAAWDNAHDMLTGGASDRELKKYLKLNGLDKKATSELMSESKAQKEAARDEERKAKRQADLEDAVNKGDASRIMKYAEEMSTQDLNNALNRVRYMASMKELGSPKKDSFLKKVSTIGNDIANAGNAVANAAAAAKKVADLFKEEESEADKNKNAAYNEGLKEASKADAKEIRDIAKKAGISARVAEKIVKDRQEQLFNGKKASSDYEKLMKIGENFKSIEDATKNAGNNGNGGGKKGGEGKKSGGKKSGDSAEPESAFDRYKKWRSEEKAKKDAAEADMYDRLLPMGQVQKPTSSPYSKSLQSIAANRKEAAETKSKNRETIERGMAAIVAEGVNRTPTFSFSEYKKTSSGKKALETKLSSIVKESMSEYPSRTASPINVSALRSKNESKRSTLNKELSDAGMISYDDRLKSIQSKRIEDLLRRKRG